MLDFNSFIAKHFGNYNPEADFNSLDKLKNEGEKYVMVIKRSSWYGIFTSLIVFLIIGVLYLNILLLEYSDFSKTIKYLINGILLFNILYGIYSLIRYVFFFRKIYGKYSKVTNIYIGLSKLKNGDIVFSKYINQNVFNMLILILLSGVMIYMSIINGSGNNIIVTIGNTILFGLQIYLSYFAIKKLINLEMDYFILTPNSVNLNIQIGFLKAQGKTLSATDIRNIDYSSSGWLPSLFKYGDLSIETIGGGVDSTGISSILPHTSHPQETAVECNNLLDGNIKEIIEKDNFYLSKILYEIGLLDQEYLIEEKIENNHIPDYIKYNKKFHLIISKYLDKNDSKIKKDFEEGDKDIKNEIELIYQNFHISNLKKGQVK